MLIPLENQLLMVLKKQKEQLLYIYYKVKTQFDDSIFLSSF